jgi:hypothetical protein
MRRLFGSIARRIEALAVSSRQKLTFILRGRKARRLMKQGEVRTPGSGIGLQGPIARGHATGRGIVTWAPAKNRTVCRLLASRTLMLR